MLTDNQLIAFCVFLTVLALIVANTVDKYTERKYPKKDEDVAEYEDLRSDLDALQEEVDSLQTQINDLQDQIFALRSQRTDADKQPNDCIVRGIVSEVLDTTEDPRR